MTATVLAPGNARGRSAVQGLTVMDVYARISVDYDGTTRSVDSQVEDCLDVIDDTPGWVLGEVHRDHAKSAWNPRVVRPEFEAMMTRLETGQAGGVLVYDLTRFTRKPIEGERLIAMSQRGVRVATLTTEHNLRTADGREAFRNAMTRAAGESDKISERSSRGKRKAARKGQSMATTRGFARDGYLLETDEEGFRQRVPADRLAREQEAVRDAAQRLLAGETLTSIAREWNETGLLTVRGCRWDASGLRLMLQSPQLAGLAVNRGEVVGRLAGSAHALDEETWKDLQLHLASRRRGRPPTQYLLSGVLTCGRCGSPLYGRPVLKQSPYPDGEQRRQYWCQYRMAEGTGCGRLTIDQRYADTTVKRAVLEVLADPRHQATLARRSSALDDRRSALQSELDRLNETVENLLDRMVRLGAQRVGKALDEAEQRVAAVEAELAQLTEDDGPVVDPEEVWSEAGIVQRRALIRRAFTTITVLPATSRGPASLTPDRFVWEVATPLEETRPAAS